MRTKKSNKNSTTRRDSLIPVPGHSGIYYRESPVRTYIPHGSTKSRPERCWVIQFYKNGKTIKETKGWESEVEWSGVIKRLGELRGGAETKTELKKAHEQAVSLNEFWDNTFKPYKEKDPGCKAFWPTISKRYEKYYRNSIGGRKLIEITNRDVDDFWTGLHSVTIKNRPIALATKVQVMQIFRQIIGYAIRREIITGKDPFADFKIPKPGKSNWRIQWFRPTEMANILKALTDPKGLYDYGREWLQYHKELHDAVSLSVMTGLRVGEIVRLRVADYKVDGGQLQVLGKNGELEEIRLPIQISQMLAKRAESKTPGDLLFPTFNGKHDRLSDRFSNVLGKLGYNKGIVDRRQRYSFHTLRHTYISWMMIQTKGNVPVVQRLARHKTLEMTMRYTHLANGNIWEAIDTLNGTFQLPKLEPALLPPTQ